MQYIYPVDERKCTVLYMYGAEKNLSLASRAHIIEDSVIGFSK
jgi:hypothetical protein